MTKAIYRQREDGDYDFVAAFDTEQMPDDWPGQIVEWLEHEGETVIVVENIALHNLADVWSDQTAGMSNKE